MLTMENTEGFTADYKAKCDTLYADYSAKRAPLFDSIFPWSVVEVALEECP